MKRESIRAARRHAEREYAQTPEEFAQELKDEPRQRTEYSRGYPGPRDDFYNQRSAFVRSEGSIFNRKRIGDLLRMHERGESIAEYVELVPGRIVTRIEVTA